MPCAGVTPGRIDSDIFCGVWGFSHTRFGGPGEKTPIAAEQACDLSAQPRRQHCRRFVRKHKCFLGLVVNRAAPTASRRYFGQEKRSSYEVRDSFKECGNGVGSAAGLQRVRSDESQFDVG